MADLQFRIWSKYWGKSALEIQAGIEAILKERGLTYAGVTLKPGWDEEGDHVMVTVTAPSRLAVLTHDDVALKVDTRVVATVGL